MAQRRRSPRPRSVEQVPTDWMRRGTATGPERERARLLGVEPVLAWGVMVFRRVRTSDERLRTARCTVRLEVASFVGAATVARAYDRARKWLWRDKLLRGESGPGRNRPETLKLAAWIARRWPRGRRVRSWRAEMATWNRYHPERRYGGPKGDDPRHFQRAVERALDLLPGAFPVPRELR